MGFREYLSSGVKSNYPDNFDKSNSITLRNILSSKMCFHAKLLVTIGSGDYLEANFAEWKAVFYAFRVLKCLLHPIVSFHLTAGQSCGVGKVVLPCLFVSDDIEAELKACLPQRFGGKARSLDSIAPYAGSHRVQPGQVRASCSAGPCLVQCCAVTILKSSVLLSQEPCVCFLHRALQILLPVLLTALWTPLWLPPRSQKHQHVWDQIPA